MERNRRMPSGLAPWAVAALLAVAAFGLFLALVDSSPLPLDRWWHDVASAPRGTAAHAVAVFFADVGGTVGAIACTGIAAAALLALRRPRDAASLAFAMMLGVAVSELLKSLVLRPRPSDPFHQAAGSAYPSGHSMGAAALAASLLLVVLGFERVRARTVRIAALVAAAWTLGMMWSRTALHVHWLSDALAGLLLGAAIAVLSRRLWFGPALRPAPARVGGHA